MNIKQQFFALIGAGLLALSSAHAADTQWFSPYPGSPLSLQPKPANQVPPNVLLFLDNSYDASRGIDTNKLPEFVGTEDRKLDVAHKVIREVVKDYPNYRWGLAGYQGYDWDASPAKNFYQGTLCSSESFSNIDGYKNWKLENCVGWEPKVGLIPDSWNTKQKKPYHHDVGSIIISANQRPFSEFLTRFGKGGIGAGIIPHYTTAKANTPYSSPLTSAYYEMTRYFRGMPSAYDKDTQVSRSALNGSVDGKAFKANNYRSPIEFRCQQNNIIIMSSARDIRVSAGGRYKAGFYDAYVTDPLYKHDNLDLAKDFSVPKSMNPKVIGTPPTPKDKHKYIDKLYMWQYKDRRIITEPNYKNYNNQFQGVGTYSLFNPNGMRLGTINYLRQLSKERIYNPYFDVMKQMKGLAGEEGVVKDSKFYLLKSKNSKYEKPEYEMLDRWDDQWVIVRNNYNETDGIASFAHLAYDADIIPDEKSAYITDLCDSTPGYDKDCKPWDGSGDNAIAIGGSGQTVDFSHRFKKQNIHTYAIGYAAYPMAKLDEFKGVRYKSSSGIGAAKIFYLNQEDLVKLTEGASDQFKTGIDDRPGWDVKGNPKGYKTSRGYFLFVEKNGKLEPVQSTDGKFVSVTTYGIYTTHPLGNDYWVNLSEDIDNKNKLNRGLEIKPGDKLYFVHPMVAFPSSKDAQTLLSEAANRGGGAYFYSAKGKEEELKRYLREVLDQIGAALTATPIGGTIATNSTSLAELKETIATTLNTDRWTSNLRFYKNDGVEIDYDTFESPAYTDDKGKPVATTLISGKDGVRRLNETEEENGITFSNDTFGIGTEYINPAKGKTLIVSSEKKDEWKSLTKWLTRSTTNDCDDSFKRTKTLSTGAVWTDFVYRNRNPNDPACTGNDKVKGDPQGRYMGDVLEGNLVLAGNEHKQADERTPRPLLMMGANDGMLHILKTNDELAAKLNDIDEKLKAPNLTKDERKALEEEKDKLKADSSPYMAELNYIPGTIKRSLKGEAVLTDGTVVGEDIIRNLVYTAEPSYGLAANAHQYFVNGKIRYAMLDNDDKGKPHMLITSTLGQGGRGAFSLNLGGMEYKGTEKIGLDADKSTWHTKVPVWETSSNAKFGAAQAVDAEGVGFITGAAPIGRFAKKNVFSASLASGKITYTSAKDAIESGDVRYGAFLSSGFDAPNNTRKLFVLDQLGINVSQKQDATTIDSSKQGELKKTFDLPAPTGSDANKKSGLAAPVLVDLNRDGIVDVAYAGDQLGDMWRFDMRGDMTKWCAVKIFAGSPTRPITAEADVFNQFGSDNVMVLFGTGSALYQTDLNDHSVQRLYGIKDTLGTHCSGSSAVVSHAAKETDLTEQKIETQVVGKVSYTGKPSKVEDDKEYRLISSKQLESGKERGWYIDLLNKTKSDADKQKQGERVLTKPLVLVDRQLNNGVVMFLTEVFEDTGDYASNPTCTAEPMEITKRIVGVDVKTGANPNPDRTGKVNLSRVVGEDPDSDSKQQIGGISVSSATNSLVPLKQSVSAISPTGAHIDGKFEPLTTTPDPELPDCWQDWYTPGLGGSINICPTTLLRVNIREVDLY